MDELHPQNPLNPYGHSKLMMERILKDFSKAYGLNVCIFRYFNACGADETSIIGESHDPETHLIPLAIRALKDGKPFYIFGSDYPTPDGTCVRDFIHILDIADAHVKGMEFLERTGGCHVFNLSSETGYSVLEVFNEIKSQLNITDAEVIYSPRRDGDSSKLVGVSTRAHEQLGWYPKYDLKKILETAIAFES
jgi:UDP-glucose 4-epimerase